MFRKGLIFLGKTAKTPVASLYSFPAMSFASEQKEVAPKAQQQEKKKDIQVYVDGQLITRNHLVLKKSEDIDAYVLKTVRNYFRTTNKQGLTLESTLLDHGLDSLDSIEISMQIEEDLGYVISAETLPVLQKVKHYANYIKHIEAYKEESKRSPLP
mmetsp:Transcript_59395/g.68808  ORF Transcript_59395/g.68808 Transcript_59395/m.68808 type:complete len:156 (+) Transcript_59395:31-498(+)